MPDRTPDRGVRLRLAVITDIHFGPDSGRKLGSKAPRLLHAFAKAVNKKGADAIIEMGDRITAGNAEDSRARMKAVRAHFNDIAAPLHSVIGNHDVRYLSLAENEEITGSPPCSYSRSINGMHLLFFNPASLTARGPRRIADEEIAWLKADLAKAKGNVIVFTHVPLDNTGAESGADARFYFAQGPDIRRIFEESGKVVLCMAGHRHTNSESVINGIHYITQQALTSMWQRSYRVPAGAWSWLEADDEKITVSLQGKIKKTYEIRL